MRALTGTAAGDYEQVLVESRDDWRAWLADNHGGARGAWVEWIPAARRPETRARRVAETARLAARGERANQWRPRGPAG